MSTGDVAPLMIAGIAVMTAGIGAIRSAFRWAKAQAKAEILRDQAKATIETMIEEVDDLKADNARLESKVSTLERQLQDLSTTNTALQDENTRLWVLLQEKSS